MRQLSLHILEVACNSADFGASLIQIGIVVSDGNVKLTIDDDGRGMDGETLKNCAKPKFSTRSSAGMGLSLLKEECERCGGELQIFSKLNIGTRVVATFDGKSGHIPALGDMGATVAPLLDDRFDLSLKADIDGKTYVFDTRKLKKTLDGKSVQSPDVIVAVKNDINENFYEIGGANL